MKKRPLFLMIILLISVVIFEIAIILLLEKNKTLITQRYNTNINKIKTILDKQAPFPYLFGKITNLSPVSNEFLEIEIEDSSKYKEKIIAILPLEKTNLSKFTAQFYTISLKENYTSLTDLLFNAEVQSADKEFIQKIKGKHALALIDVSNGKPKFFEKKAVIIKLYVLF